MTSKIFLYAEVLANIRQVTLYASLQSERNEETKVDIASDRKTISVTHDGETSSIFLPTAISGSANLTIPAKRAKELSLRLEIAPLSELAPRADAIDDEVPWSATSLKASTTLSCRNCNHALNTPSTTVSWRDLPSENWAEMMDFWHCHRPHDNQHADNAAASSKGYGTSNTIHASSGAALVDTLSFLVAEADFPGVKMTQAQLPNGQEKLQCANCDHLIGFADKAAHGYRLYKWSLLLQTPDCPSLDIVPAERFICSQLLALIDSTGVRKFILHSGTAQGPNDGLLLWVFNPDLHYSSSKITGAKRAMKVFHCAITNVQRLLDENSVSMEELFLPTQILEDFCRVLDQSNRQLPTSARKFQSWDVALLDRSESIISAQEFTNTMSELGIAKDSQDESKYLYD